MNEKDFDKMLEFLMKLNIDDNFWITFDNITKNEKPKAADIEDKKETDIGKRVIDI